MMLYIENPHHTKLPDTKVPNVPRWSKTKSRKFNPVGSSFCFFFWWWVGWYCDAPICSWLYSSILMTFGFYVCWPTLGDGRDQAEWDALYNEFITCGENWLKSDLVMKSMAVREHSTKGTWALMSKVVPLLQTGWDIFIVLHLQSCHANVSLLGIPPRSCNRNTKILKLSKTWSAVKPRPVNMSPIRTSQTPRTTRIYKLYYLSTILYI